MTTESLLLSLGKSFVVILVSLYCQCHAYSLEGKRALVTGSSGGIGAGIAKELAKHGAHVLVHYHTRHEGAIATQSAIEREGGICVGIVQCDFRSPQAMDQLFDNVVDKVWPEGLDILVNNAGIVTKLALEDDDKHLSAWHETLQVNLHAPLQLSRLAHCRMANKRSNGRGGGVILNVSSIHGERSVEYMVAYAASKAALDCLTRGLALEYATDGIRVNGIAPGVVPVERTAQVFHDPKVVDMWTQHLPTGKVGSVEEVAQATIPLCTNEWITGTTWVIDGGMLARSNTPIRPKPPASPQDAKPQQKISDQVRFEQKNK
eukprot:scaffold6007_cov183-Amphora_coffeaeformis.AAC.21